VASSTSCSASCAAGAAAGGAQWMSWIHHEDFSRALLFLIEREDLEGPVNVAAPEPLPNAAFMRALRDAWGTRIGLPATRWMLEIGALFLRTETELVLKSRRVVPARLLAEGFAFRHPSWPAAARELCREWRTT
jgi:NAD dependent epimerase/dehydratase family enzyme